jgi:hypothetical protein
MLKIVEVHASDGVRGEYVVLQNMGLVTVSLRGWALCTDAYLDGDEYQIAAQLYVFRDDMPIKPYTRVVLFTGSGVDGWQPTTDGRQAYCAYWNRAERIWSVTETIHVLHLSASKRIPIPAEAVTTQAAAGV